MQQFCISSVMHKKELYYFNVFKVKYLSQCLFVVIQIPKSYLTLQEAIKAECLRRDEADEVQYLTDTELEHIIEQSPASDIKDYEDLQTGNA